MQYALSLEETMKEKDYDLSRRLRQSEKGRKAQKVRNLINGVKIQYHEDDFEELGSFTKILTSRKLNDNTF